MSSSSSSSSDQHLTVLGTPKRTIADVLLTSSDSHTPQKKTIKDYTWDDILVSAEETNPCIRKPPKNAPVASVPCSRLVSIGNTSTVAISLDNLRKLGSKLGIPNCRRIRKQELCHAIVLAKGRNNIEAANGTIEVIDDDQKSKSLFCDEILPTETCYYRSVQHSSDMTTQERLKITLHLEGAFEGVSELYLDEIYDLKQNKLKDDTWEETLMETGKEVVQANKYRIPKALQKKMKDEIDDKEVDHCYRTTEGKLAYLSERKMKIYLGEQKDAQKDANIYLIFSLEVYQEIRHLTKAIQCDNLTGRSELKNKQSNTVIFDVGGTKYKVSRLLLEIHPNTMLARSASRQWQEDPESEIFIEQDGDRFKYCLDYLRHGHVILPMTVSKRAVMGDLTYYGVENVDEGAIETHRAQYLEAISKFAK